MVVHAGMEELTLNAGASTTGSYLNVTSLPAAPVTVNLGSVLNDVTVGQAAASVDGRLTVNGSAGIDLLTINDQALLLATPATYTVTSTEVGAGSPSTAPVLRQNLLECNGHST